MPVACPVLRVPKCLSALLARLLLPGMQMMASMSLAAGAGEIPGLRGEKWAPTRAATAEERTACAQALLDYQSLRIPEKVDALTGFLAAHPESPYRLAVLTTLGGIYYRTTQLSAALEAYEQAWAIGAAPDIDPKASAMAGKAAGELALMYARLGRYESLEALLKQVEGRTFSGSGGNLLDDARMGFGLMTSNPGISFRCGPLALSRILASQGQKDYFPAPLRDSVSTRQGFSLTQTRDFALAAGMTGFRMAKRAPGAAIIAPAVVHWKVGHYAALLGPPGSTGRYQVEDPTFATQTPLTISPAALDAEGSGYFLVNADPLPPGWTAVDDAEGAQVFGKGATGGPDPDGTHPSSPKVGSNGNKGKCPGMADWGVHTSVVSLNVMDTPLTYSPPVGFPVDVTMTYNSRESQAVATQPITDTGGRWLRSTVAYLSYEEEVGVNVLPGTGARNYYKWNAQTDTWQREKRTYSTLERLPNGSFQVSYPDGSVEIYSHEAWGWDTFTREYFRTSLKDPAGNETQFQYEQISVQGTFGEWTRLKKIIDPVGGETLFQYTANGLDPSRVTDPSGRFAEFNYDADGRLVLIRDVAGLESRFRYQGITDLMEALITPYGETRFEYGEEGPTRWLETTHPNGDKERVEFRHKLEGIPAILPAVPTGILVGNNYNNERNALYWDRKAMRDAPGDVNAAQITHFLHTPNINISSDLIESVKAPLEGRIWFEYRGQTSGISAPSTPDTRMVKMGRLLDDGTSQIFQFDTNDLGNTTLSVDPAGRTTTYIYAENMIDLLEVRQKTGANTYDTLLTATYNTQHKPVTLVDAGGNTTTFSYNTRGQILTITEALGRTTTFTYDALGHLISADGPLPGTSDKGTFGYDSAHRLVSITDGASRTITLQYDALNRLIKKTYPNGEFEQWTYELLDLKSVRSVSGRVTTYKRNVLRQLTEIADTAGRRTLLDWCRCGGLKTIIDPLGKITRFSFDVQGRITGRTNPDGTTTQQTYEPVSGRLSKLTDELGRQLTFAYNADNSHASLSYGGAAPATPPISYTYDANYLRPVQVTQGAEVTAMTYVPATSGQKGIGLLSTVDGPLANDTVAYTYDAVSRIVSKSINGVARSTIVDEAGRLTSLTNSLGTITFGYGSLVDQLTSETLPNGQINTRQYAATAAPQRISEISHHKASNQLISRFAFTYDVNSRIIGLTRQIDAGGALNDTSSYDALSRLVGYQKAQTGGGTQAFGYAYDEADNRVTETIDGVSRSETPDLMNALTASQPSSLPSRSYEWDAAGRLAAVVQGTHRSEFSYNAVGQRSRIVEKENSVVIADRRFVYIGMELAEERNAANAVVKRFFAHGFTSGANKFFYTRDHLGSIREVTDEAGTVRARYDYDPYGRRTKVSGDVDADLGYTGHFHHADSGLTLTFARAYDANLGRWISRDPSGWRSGTNAYCYVANDPLSLRDALGLDAMMAIFDAGGIAHALDLASHAFFDGASDAATNPQNLGSAATIGVTAAALPAAAPLGVAAGVVIIGMSSYNIGANTYGDVGKHFGIESQLTGSMLVDGVRWHYGGAGVAPNAEKIAYGCDLLIQTALGKPLGAATDALKASGPLARGFVAGTEQAGAALYMQQGNDLFGPENSPFATQPAVPSSPTAEPNFPPF